jgi:hypothetical protein
MAIFDSMQRRAVDKVNNLMGDAGTWQPSAGGDLVTGFFLFEDATRAMELLGMEFDPKNILAEYFEPDFPGLAQSANNGGTEIVTIKGVEYNVRQVLRKYDGKTQIAVLETR